MDLQREIARWTEKHGRLLAEGNLDAADEVGDHIRRLRALAGEPEPEHEPDLGAHLAAVEKALTTRQAEREKVGRGMEAATRLVQLNREIAELDAHAARLKQLIASG